MAKDIKAIQCPKCGSTYKQEIKPDFYKCQSCQTEYYLDSDDLHVYHHHERVPPVQSSAPPGNTKLPVYILIGAVLFISIIYFITIQFQPKRSTYNTNSTYKMPRFYHTNFVYTNTVTGAPVYLRIGSDYMDKGNNKSEQELHAQFNDPVTGKLIADRIITYEGLRGFECRLTFKAYSPEMIYAISCGNNLLLRLDTKSNQLINVTQSLFKDYPQLSSGIARMEFDYDKSMINIMNNEGNSYHYFPEKQRLIANAEQAESFWKKEYDRHYFEFGYLGDYFDDNKFNQLIENQYAAKTGRLQQRDLTPGRKYFNPQIIYQNSNNLLIVVNTTAATNSPVSIQCIDVQTGKLKWALPPDTYNLHSTTKCKQGFAIEYSNEEADYVHGVLVVSDAGKLIHNYKLSRNE